MSKTKKIYKKLKVIFVDMVDVRLKRARTDAEISLFSTFYGYKFEKNISFREQQQFGWTTFLEKKVNGGIIDFCIHIIDFSFLKREGILQRFYSPHGRDYDDDYSYLQGMNFLAFEGFSKTQTRRSAKRLLNIIKQSSVLVDDPRIGLLVPTKTIDRSWVKHLKSNVENVHVSDDVTDLIPDIISGNFVDYSLSRGYEHHLGSYVELLESIIQYT